MRTWQASLFAAALVVGGAASASEPVQLTATELDSVSAGFTFIGGSEAVADGAGELGLLGGSTTTSSSTDTSSTPFGGSAGALGTGSVTRPALLGSVTHNRSSACSGAACFDSASLPPATTISEGASVLLGYSIGTFAATDTFSGFIP